MDAPTWANAVEPQGTSAVGQFKPAKLPNSSSPCNPEFTLGQYMRTLTEKGRRREEREKKKKESETAKFLIRSICGGWGRNKRLWNAQSQVGH